MDNITNIEFWNEFELQLDERMRLVMPQEWRDQNPGDFYMMRGPENCLLIFAQDGWDRIKTALNSHLLQKELIVLQRMLGGRCKFTPDSNGRFTLPKPLREWTSLNDKDMVTMVGHGNKIEIWSKDKWKQYCQNSMGNDAFWASAEIAGLSPVLFGQATQPLAA